MASDEPRYTVSELEQHTGISRRTIHFYVKEGVIAPPDGVAGGARYGDEHLLRLKLTRELQKSHLKLSGIREAMDRLSLDQMRSMLLTAKSSAGTWDRAALERWLEQRVVSIRAGAHPGRGTLTRKSSGDTADPPLERVGEPPSAWNQSFLDIAEGSNTMAAGSAGRVGDESAHAPPALTQQSWDRIQIAEGLEVLVRSDLLPGYQHVIAEIVRLLGSRR